MRNLLICLLVAGLSVTVLPQDAFAQSAEARAEARRLQGELERRAQRGAWEGVEGTYQRMLVLDTELEFDAHMIGAQAAGALGKTWERYQRLESALAMQQEQDIIDSMSAIDGAYGRVRLRGNPRWDVVFSRPVQPFIPDQRKSIEYGSFVLTEGGEFEGMLPAGEYVLGGEGTKETLPFTVEPGEDWQVIDIQRAYARGGEGIVYHGPIATLGYAFTASPEPSAPVLIDGFSGGQRHSAQPGSVTGSGLGMELGWEVGPTRLLAAAASLSYSGLVFGGEDTFHMGYGWAGIALRPGNLRIAVGPTYGVLRGKGTGVIPSFDVGQDPGRYQPQNIGYKGSSWASGARLTASYGLLDLEPLQGVVELGGHWQTDGARSYFDVGIRVGIVPKVPRFEG